MSTPRASLGTRASFHGRLRGCLLAFLLLGATTASAPDVAAGVPVPALLRAPRAVTVMVPHERTPAELKAQLYWGLGRPEGRRIEVPADRIAEFSTVFGHPVPCPPESLDRMCNVCSDCPNLMFVFSSGEDSLIVWWNVSTSIMQVSGAGKKSSLLYAGLDGSAAKLLSSIQELAPGDSILKRMRTKLPAFVPATDSASVAAPLEPLDQVVRLPEPMFRAAPEYPAEAREKGVDGVVRTLALVGADGNIRDAYVTHSIPLLDEAALTAVRKFVFRPMRCGGQPVAIWVVLPVRFTLH